MHVSILEFFVDITKAGEFDGKRILEIGSRYVNGSVRPLIEKFSAPKEYIGVDIEPGKFVDVVLPAEKIVDYFGSESFDVVVTTEFLEHFMDWRVAINNMKTVLKRGGVLCLTTRSKGFQYHAFPYDFWRYEMEDMEMIFKDFEIIALKKESDGQGVFLKAKKTEKYVQADLSEIALYSMVSGRRTRSIPNNRDMPLARKFMVKLFNSKLRFYLPQVLSDYLKKSYLT